jgi:hypothetical protein
VRAVRRLAHDSYVFGAFIALTSRQACNASARDACLFAAAKSEMKLM